MNNTTGAAELPEALRWISTVEAELEGVETDDANNCLNAARGALAKARACVEALSAAQAGGPAGKVIAWRLIHQSSLGHGDVKGSWIDGAPTEWQITDFSQNAPMARIEYAYAAPQPSPSPAPAQINTKTHDLLSTMIGLFLGAKDKIGYKPGSAIEKVVAEAVEHLKGWPYQESAPAQPGQEGKTADPDVLDAAMRAIQQAIQLIGDPADERLSTVRRVLRGAVVVAEDADRAARAAPQPVQGWGREYYYRVEGCKAQSSDSSDCICWHKEGTGPLATDTKSIRSWRAARAAPQPATGAEPFGWVKSSEIESSKAFGGSINLWRRKYDCDTPVYLTPQPATADALPDEKTCADYVLQYGGRCRDCADENGICPGSGLPCGGARKAVTHVVQALRYGLQHGYLRAAQREVKP